MQGHTLLSWSLSQKKQVYRESMFAESSVPEEFSETGNGPNHLPCCSSSNNNSNNNNWPTTIYCCSKCPHRKYCDICQKANAVFSHEEGNLKTELMTDIIHTFTTLYEFHISNTNMWLWAWLHSLIQAVIFLRPVKTWTLLLNIKNL